MYQKFSKLFVVLFAGAGLVACNNGSGSASGGGLQTGRLNTKQVAANCNNISCEPGVYLIESAGELFQLSEKLIKQDQQSDQWSNNHYAVLVKPGTYNVTGSDGAPYAFNLGYYTQILGVGKSMNDTTLIPGVQAYNLGGNLKGAPSCPPGNNNPLCTTVGGLNNFWRGIENFSMDYSNLGHALIYAVSQAAPIRSIHFHGGSQPLLLCDYNTPGWACGFTSGGVMANSVVDGDFTPGSQQQWLTMNSNIGGKAGNAIWNSISVGTQFSQPPVAGSDQAYRMPADNQWSNFPVSNINTISLYRGKPYLSCDGDCNDSADNIKWKVLVPGLRQNFTGTDTGTPAELDVSSQFFIISPELGTTSTTNVTTLDKVAIKQINDALANGKNLIITPGVYDFDGGSINITKNDTIVLGLGLPSLVCTSGDSCINVSAEQGVQISGVTFDAGYKLTPNLLQIGSTKNSNDNSADPIFLHDVYFRVAETQLESRIVGEERQTTAALSIYTNNVIGDNLWVWRADHDKASSHDMTNANNNHVEWTQDRAQYGVIIAGDNVTMYGLAVEHFQNYQTVWSGEHGKVYFYQSEMPYDVPSLSDWACSYPESSNTITQHGCASYVVEPQVKSHDAAGVGIYTFFSNAPIVAPSGILAPATVDIEHMVGKWLDGNHSSGYSNLVANNITNPACYGYGVSYGVNTESANQISVLGAFNSTAATFQCGGQ